MTETMSKRADEVLRRLLKTPPTPHVPLKAKRKAKRTNKAKAGKRSRRAA
jgi:hypothetical protein